MMDCTPPALEEEEKLQIKQYYTKIRTTVLE